MLKQVNFVEGNEKFVHEDLAKDNALERLSLNELLAVDHKDHQINDGSTSNHCLHETGMARAVNQCELYVLYAV